VRGWGRRDYGTIVRVRSLTLAGSFLMVAACGAMVAACGAPSATYDAGHARPSGAPAVPSSAFGATVERVVDGDTFIARRGGRSLRVRLIGINAPESVKPGSPVECFGPESSQVLHDLLPAGAAVRAAYEDGGQRDQYGRELWDVWLHDGQFLQAMLVERGAARPRLYRPQHDYAELLAALGDRARAQNKGLYARCEH
jgi:micrococcal nuclease